MGTFRKSLALTVIFASLTAAKAQDTNLAAPSAGPADAGLAAPVPADAGQPVPQPAITPQDPNADLPAIDPQKPAPVPKKPAVKKKAAPKGPALPSAKGSITNVDKTKMTVTLDTKGGEQTFRVTSKTRIFVGTKPAVFSDGAVGDQATVEFRKGKDGAEAEALTLVFAAKK